MHIVRYLRGVLAPSKNCSIDIETLWPEKPAGKNDLNKAPLGLTNSNFDQLCGEAILSISLKTWPCLVLLWRARKQMGEIL